MSSYLTFQLTRRIGLLITSFKIHFETDGRLLDRGLTCHSASTYMTAQHRKMHTHVHALSGIQTHNQYLSSQDTTSNYADTTNGPHVYVPGL